MVNATLSDYVPRVTGEVYSWPHYLIPIGIIGIAVFIIYLLSKGEPYVPPQELRKDVLGLSIGYAGILFEWHLFMRYFGL